MSKISAEQLKQLKEEPSTPHMKWSVAKTIVLEEVDIIVPFHGQYQQVGKLIESLWKSTRGIYYNIYLVDDGSPNREFMEKIKGMKVPSMFFARHPERRGFGAAINTGLKMTKSPWIVIANSDVSFEDGSWLKSMGETYHRLKSQGVRMVSAKMDNAPPGDPRVVGVKTEPTPDVIIEPKDIEQIVQEDMFLPFVCTLAHRDLFQTVGMVKEYPLGWYEDVEFACRMFAKGHKQAICGKAAVVHEGGSTVNAICDGESKNRLIFESNFDRCCLDIKSLQNKKY